jgi:cellulose synthase/poly-beta-1,6-N-acetylglucosamine synthase-like glycosyltransferase
MLLTTYSIVVTAGWIATSIWILINSSRIKKLKDVPEITGVAEPGVAIIIAVRNEEAELEQALKSVCNLTYNNYRVIIINDRSTDSTPAILNRMAASDTRISIMTIDELPKGWLGKNHALYQGYLASNEEWLLFTDADILYGRDALRKAITYALANHLDHLTALPEITSQSNLFKSVVNIFAVMLEARLRPWAASNPRSNASIGIGAFNLVKRSAYEKAGTHLPISLRPDDDLKLGESIKKAGLRQDVVYGEKEISLAWYNSLDEFIRGLMKNTFAVANYNLLLATGSAILTFIVFVLPLPLLFFMGQTGQLMAVAILITQVILLTCKKGVHGKWWHALLIPFAGTVMVYIIVKSAVKTLQQGGIYWRDSFYSLDELKQQR